jgi:DNA-binding response OmpR family regulator
MKMILVAARGEQAISLGYHLKPLGFTVEHFADPVRVAQQLEEIDPQAIVFDAGDFPRHWKPLLKLAREKKPREELIFLLIAPEDFPQEDAWKAAHLGVNGILTGKFSDRQELYRLEEIVRRYRAVSDKRNFTRLVPQQEDELGFAFTHPNRMALVTGKVREISIQGSSFLPARPSAVGDLVVGNEIKDCSLKIEDRIIAVTCKVTRNRAELGFQFLSFEEGGHHALLSYIQSRSERALKSVTSGATTPRE